MVMDFKAAGRKGTDTDMVVKGGDVYRRQAAPEKAPPPKPAPTPRPQPAPMPPRPQGPKYGAFNEGAAGPPPAPKPKPKARRQENKEERQERRQENHGRARRAPKRDATAEEEAAHDRKNIDAAVANNRKTSERRKELAQRNKDRKAAREAAAKGAVPAASANIPDPAAAGPSNHGEHQHHHTGHRKMHDDNFATGM